jgi:O-antigen/teichoic acid export membrane protein
MASRTWKAAVLSSGQFFVTLNGIVLAAILARLFSKQDYAAYQQTLVTYNIVAPLLALGLANALYYFIPRDKSRARSILTGNLLLLFLAGSVFAVVIWCGANRLLAQRFSNAAVRDLLLIYSPYAMLALPVGAVNACLLSCGKTNTSAVFNMLSRFLTLVCVVGLVLIWRGPRAAITGIVIAEFFVFLAALLLMYRIAPGDRWQPDPANIWEQIRFSIPLGLASMIGIMSRSVDKVVVSSMCSPEQFAVYVNGAIDIPLIGILTGSINIVLLPEIVELYSKGSAPAALVLWRRAAVKCSLVLLPTMCFLFAMAPEVMRVLFSAEYSESAIPFRLYLVMVPIRVVAWEPMLMAAGKSSWILSRTVVSLLINIALSVFLVRYMGYIGAIVGSICELYLWHTPFYCAAISKLYHCPLRSVLPLRKISLIMFLCLVACIVFLAKPFVPIHSDLLLLGVFGLLYVCMLTVLMILSGTISPANIRAAISLSAGGVSSVRIPGE